MCAYATLNLDSRGHHLAGKHSFSLSFTTLPSGCFPPTPFPPPAPPPASWVQSMKRWRAIPFSPLTSPPHRHRACGLWVQSIWVCEISTTWVSSVTSRKFSEHFQTVGYSKNVNQNFWIFNSTNIFLKNILAFKDNNTPRSWSSYRF